MASPSSPCSRNAVHPFLLWLLLSLKHCTRDFRQASRVSTSSFLWRFFANPSFSATLLSRRGARPCGDVAFLLVASCVKRKDLLNDTRGISLSLLLHPRVRWMVPAVQYVLYCSPACQAPMNWQSRCYFHNNDNHSNNPRTLNYCQRAKLLSLDRRSVPIQPLSEIAEPNTCKTPCTYDIFPVQLITLLSFHPKIPIPSCMANRAPI